MISKADKFTAYEIKLAEIAKALAHPARIKILKILSEMNVCMTGDIVDLLPLSQSTVSQHLNELKKVGLIKGEIDGPKTCYCINEPVLRIARDSLGEMLNQVCKC